MMDGDGSHLRCLLITKLPKPSSDPRHDDLSRLSRELVVSPYPSSMVAKTRVGEGGVTVGDGAISRRGDEGLKQIVGEWPAAPVEDLSEFGLNLGLRLGSG